MKKLRVLYCAFGKATADELGRRIKARELPDKDWSPMQHDVRAWVKEHIVDVLKAGALIVKAGPGSGKTTTAESFMEDMDGADIMAKTLNGLGSGAVWMKFKPKLDTAKTFSLVRNMIKHGSLPSLADVAASEIVKLISKAKAHGMVPADMPNLTGLYKSSPERWLTLAERYDIDAPDHEAVSMSDVTEWAEKVLKAGLTVTDVIDFDDQKYFPIAFNLPVRQFDVIVLDEAQDCSHVDRALIKKALAKGGVFVAIGDEAQSIYGFRGADSESMTNLETSFGADFLPLTVSYRCARAIVDEAKRVFPDGIEAAPGAAEGKVETLETLNPRELRYEDMVLCRNNAPLIDLAYRLIRMGIGARVKGRDIGENLINLSKRVAGKRNKQPNLGLPIRDFEKKLTDWAEAEADKARQRHNEGKIDQIYDKLETVRVIIDQAANVNNVGDLCHEIGSLFADNGERAGPELSTVHKAKGLEAERVYILEPDLMPSKWARQDWQIKQEHHLLFVAITRAKRELYYINLDNIVEPKVTEAA